MQQHPSSNPRKKIYPRYHDKRRALRSLHSFVSKRSGTKASFTAAPGVSSGTYGIVNRTGNGKRVVVALGAGVEYGITQNVSAKFEYLYVAAASLDISNTNSKSKDETL